MKNNDMCVLLYPNKIEVRTLFHLTVNTTLKVHSTGHHCSGGGYSKLQAAATVNSRCRDSTYGALTQNDCILKAFVANQP